MTTDIKQATSRPFGVAELLTGRALDPDAVYSRTVVLTGESKWLGTRNGQWCFIDALRLLARVVGHLVVIIPAELADLRQQVSDICAKTWSIDRIEFIDHEPELIFSSARAILNVGSKVQAGRPCTTINADGWIARCSTTEDLQDPLGHDNPIAALMAASFGAAEVFKRIFEIPAEIAPPIDSLEFSLYELTNAPTSFGPSFPESLNLKQTLVIGSGAIGNGIALLTAQSGATGELHFIDYQVYRDENLGTSILLEREGWLGESKAERLAAWLNSNGQLRASADTTMIEAAIYDGRLERLAPRIVINGLDDASARRESQRLWPDIIIDGAINEIGAAVTQYRIAWRGAACLQCWFEAPPVDAKDLQSQATGLHRDSLDDLNRQLTEADIAAALESKREWLNSRRCAGKTLCSVITELQMATRLNAPLVDGFRPSVPFIATAAAALVMSSLVKYLAHPEAPSEQLFQLGNVFLGPTLNVTTSRKANAGCTCVIHGDAIRRLRSAAGRQD